MFRHPLRLYVVALLGILGFSALMAIRDGARGIVVRALVAALAGLVGSSAFLYVVRTMKTR